MEEQHLSTLAATHLLQHTLRSFCKSQWVYAVFWRILPRNYPPPIWEDGDGAFDRSRGNIRNWYSTLNYRKNAFYGLFLLRILAWEDGFCNFATPSGNGYGIQPEVFFKMSHEIYNYGEGLVGKVAAHRTHKWVFNEPWNTTGETIPRTWEAQFQHGIKTIALVAVREGVVQLGAVNWANEDLNFVVSLRRKMGFIECIPGVLFPHPVSSQVVPSMSSLDALLSKLPPVTPPPQHNHGVVYHTHYSSQKTEVEE